MNHGILISSDGGSWGLTVNHEGDTWDLETQEAPPPGYLPDYQTFTDVSLLLRFNLTNLIWLGGTAWIGFNTDRAILDVAVTLAGEGQLTISSAVDSVTTTSNDKRFLLALTPAALETLGREASQPQAAAAIDLPPEVVASLRAAAQPQAG
jgi:hypothetical protein